MKCPRVADSEKEKIAFEKARNSREELLKKNSQKNISLKWDHVKYLFVGMALSLGASVATFIGELVVFKLMH